METLRNGPRFCSERNRHDFGIYHGFYLTPEKDLAIKWAARASFNNEGGIVLFSLNLKDLENIMIFESPNDEWKALVKNSRTGKEQRSNKLDKFNFVYGPTLENVSDITKPGVEAKAHSPIRWQLASKNDKSDLILKDLMVGAIICSAGRSPRQCSIR